MWKTPQPTGHTTLLRRWINVIDVDSTSQQRRVAGGKWSEDADPQCIHPDYYSSVFTSDGQLMVLCNSRSTIILAQANTRRWTNVVLMLVQRRRPWPNIKKTWVQPLVFAGRPLFDLANSSETNQHLQTSLFSPVLFWCWARVVDGGSALKQHWVLASCVCMWLAHMSAQNLYCQLT